MTGHTEQHEAGELAETLADALEKVIGCFEAARIEGLTEQLAAYEAEPGNLVDLVKRRLAYAEFYAADALKAWNTRTPPTPAPDSKAGGALLVYELADTLEDARNNGFGEEFFRRHVDELLARARSLPTPNTEPAGGWQHAQWVAAVFNLTLALGPAREALKFYAEHVGNCRKNTGEGNASRARLDADCGKRAKEALVVPHPQAWSCAARKQSLPEPADCDWPLCGCDPAANKVIETLEESGAGGWQQAQARKALKAARQFITNGVEFGYIRMPDADTPDTAHDTLPLIEAALAALTQPSGERS